MTPWVFYSSWSIFIFSTSTVVSLVALLLSSLGLPLIFTSYTKIFWPCGLFMILMSTGLIVVFAYIVSLHPKEKDGSNTAMLGVPLMGVLSMMWPTLGSVQGIHSVGDLNVGPLLSLLLICMLLFLVIAFIRIVYSKGGGFRKKF